MQSNNQENLGTVQILRGLMAIFVLLGILAIIALPVYLLIMTAIIRDSIPAEFVIANVVIGSVSLFGMSLVLLMKAFRM